MYDLLTYALAILAVYRASMLVVEDQITEPVREFIWRRFPTDTYFYLSKYLTVTGVDKDGSYGVAKAWPFKRRTDDKRMAQDNTWIGNLLKCVYCVSVWLSAGAVIILNETLSLPYDAYAFLNFFAIAGGVELLNNRLGRH